MVIWGLAFVATKLALESFSPPQLTALRFLIAALPALVLPRPALTWPRLVAIGATLFAGQFLLQFFAIANGLPPGLASVLVQTQALFTIVFAAMALGEQPTARQVSGVMAAFAGLVLILLTVGQNLTIVGFGLAMGSAISWGIGNVLLKRIRDVEMLSLIVWLSLVPPLPALALSLMLDGPAGFAAGRLERLGARGRGRAVSRRRRDHPGLRHLGSVAAPLPGGDGHAVRPAGAVRRRLFLGSRVR